MNILVAFALVAVSISVLDATPKPSSTAYTFTERVWNEYLLTNGKVPYRGATSESVASVAGRHWYGDLYLYRDLRDMEYKTTGGDEFDITLGYKWSEGRYSFDLGIDWADLGGLAWDDSDIRAPFAKVSYLAHKGKDSSVAPFVKMKLPRVVGHPERSGVILQGGVAHTLVLDKDLFLASGLSVIWNSEGTFALREGHICRAQFELEKKVGRGKSILLDLTGSVPEHEQWNRKKELAFAVGYRLRF